MDSTSFIDRDVATWILHHLSIDVMTWILHHLLIET